MAFICSKPKNSCRTCSHYKFDAERGENACFIKQDIGNIATFENYKKAIKDNNLELAREIYDLLTS